MNKLNPSIKYHLLVGLFFALWGFLFMYMVKPFSDQTTGFIFWIRSSIGFNLIAFITYGLIAVIQKAIFEKIQRWSVGLEVSTLLFFYIIHTIGTFALYKSPIINGGYTFLEWNTEIMLRAAIVNLTILAIARSYLIKLIPEKEDTLTIKGDNKLDILKIKKAELICVSNAQNYVEIFYTQSNTLHSKLIRTSLRNLKAEFNFLLQVHRSHLINPTHFKSWKDSNTIYLTEIELPVSKTFNKELLSA
ncbi:transcriptional regulator, LytTR family [Ekhidna lutea]|uniref:Transcriptional regulator, LytTR family n=1 Tax=Ekhidna lutea TaxID=447679 RepID=A0A239M1V9_EKHLU|nr:LytTR family DNA-binding domain-containing protein [Ekhidna lutea]SNT36661.1 transcriptional regulator, LytTR family [Ekhidna lutea]